MSRLKIANQKREWRSLDELAGQPDQEIAVLESPQGAKEWEQTEGLSRRGFMGAAGTTVAASAALLSGCIRKEAEFIVPLSERPEDRVPGTPLEYNTVASLGGTVLGLRVSSMDGRPTKVEGNPNHPNSNGAASVFAQASIMGLYDPDRTHVPHKGAEPATWADVDAWAKGAISGDGDGTAILLDDSNSPTVARLLGELLKKHSRLRVFRHDAVGGNARAGAALVGLTGHTQAFSLENAKVILSADADFLGTDGDVVRNNRGYARSRAVTETKADISRLYAVEPGFSNTGAMADNRLRLRGSAIGGFLAAVATKVFGALGSTPAGSKDVMVALKADASGNEAWVDAVAKDLVANQGKSAVLVGSGQPAWVHGLGMLMNAALGNTGKTVKLVASDVLPGLPGLDELVAVIKARGVKTLVMLGGNPALTAPAELDFKALMGSVATTVHLSDRLDETSRRATMHVPVSHYLESWGDHVASDGTMGIQQPLIAPLFGTISAPQLLGRLLGSELSGFQLVQETTKGLAGGTAFGTAWRRWLHEGVVYGPAEGVVPLAAGSVAPVAAPAAAIEDESAEGEPVEGDVDGGEAPAEEVAPVAVATWDFSKLAAAARAAGAAGSGLEISFQLDPRVYDGRFANVAWLQELPCPVSKLSWDNAALVSPATAGKLSIERGDLVDLTVDGRTVRAATFLVPGITDDVVVLTLGHGRGEVGGRFCGGGFNAWPAKGASWFAAVEVKKTGENHKLVTTQEHGRLDPKLNTPVGVYQPKRRPMVMETTATEYDAKPHFARHEPLFALKSMWEQPNVTGGHQWGMVIDLNNCTGCNACTVACNAENNVLVVGKDRVAKGREMHWLRLDRYFTGAEDNPEVVFQPIGCAQCETAPCEQVCPVGATSHSPEGLNDMAYNRCIGTRYCANNCPFKVRRFNYFNFANENHDANELLRMQMNPNVTVRFRGVIEKCTYCVQRISAAKVAAKRSTNDGIVTDGTITPACAQTCPAEAITFGDINDPNSMVSKKKASVRNYALLADLNIHPRTSFLAKIRNPNPELA